MDRRRHLNERRNAAEDGEQPEHRARIRDRQEERLRNVPREVLQRGLAAGRRILIVADYDCDGATGCAVGLRALRMMGATVDYLVPDRFVLGYGLSPEVALLAAERKPDLVITIDNGIGNPIANLVGMSSPNVIGLLNGFADSVWTVR